MRNETGYRSRAPRARHDGVAVEPGAEVFGSAEHVRETFIRAAGAANRAIGLWLERHETGVLLADRREPGARGAKGELQALRAMLRASVTAYVRHLRDQGATPERMLVLVKTAAADTVTRGVEARELTDDLVRWSIEAFFDD